MGFGILMGPGYQTQVGFASEMNAVKTSPGSAKLRLRPRERRTLLLLVDLLMAILALTIATYVWSVADPYQSLTLTFLRRLPLWFYLLPFAWPFLMVRLYDEHRARDHRQLIGNIAVAALIGLGMYMVVFFTSQTPKDLPRIGVASFIVSVFLLTLFWRLIYIRVFTAPQFMRRVLLVGAGETGNIILKIINEIKPRPYILAGIIDDDPQKIGKVYEGYEVFGGCDKLLDAIANHQITDLIVAISGQMHGGMFQALLDAQQLGIEIIRMPVAYEELLHRVPVRYLEAEWILRSFVDKARSETFSELLKRSLDILGGLIGIAALVILYPFVAIAILIESGRPVLYKQVRMGLGGQLYSIYKFRTMRQDAEANGQPQWAEENDRRATKVGLFLRKTHTDEIPQFYNVLLGEMSLVGPRAERPELVEWFQKHVPFYRARLLVRPGITGWAQVNQQYAATIDETIEKLEYDLYYIMHRNFLMDLRIIATTPSLVFRFKGR
jgi:exopolysaccharide biosynthesis polyprenyl glycosylphosphotransferase